ncbi:DUF3084 domain-containing protein [Halanaerobacter jeridensis]|uniref:Cell division protein FtsB n=1 Tax=Halanaerobacter jeridensis TaxID=706427 RepID=A0A938XPQ4_9FIRM|nr:DUF3084 domain-containing protein [Halanaerobacter jeridensis]MBM7556962.1 cell division protein FtsB [Halanaerobacter jeridensis]
MYGLPLILILIVIGGLIAYVGDKIGMKVGKNRLSLFGLRPKYSSIIITVVTGVLITIFSVSLMMLASQKARIAVFRLDDLLLEIERSKAELDTLRADKKELQQQTENLAHNLKLFGEKYFLYLNQEVLYKKGVEVSQIIINDESKEEISTQLNNWLQQLDSQAQELEFNKLRYNGRELDKLITILTEKEASYTVRLITANNIFKGDDLVVKFDLVGVNL